MPNRFLAAAVQMTSGPDVAKNQATVQRLVRTAAQRGARLVGLPENFHYLGPEGGKLAVAETLDGPGVQTLKALARETGVWLLAGGFPEKGPDPKHTYNTALLLSPKGELTATYRKIHMFDVDLADGTALKESDSVAPGNTPVVVETELCKLGLSICYDLRFPELYRQLSARGAQLITVPAAFTMYTGKDHWLPLLRARAIENQCWVMAPAQYGNHIPGRVSYGKACIIDPWGIPVGVASDGEGLVAAEIDLEYLEGVRRQVPCLKHRVL